MQPSETESAEELAEVPFNDPGELLYRKLEPTDVLGEHVMSSGFAFEKPKKDGNPSGISFSRSALMPDPYTLLIGKKPGCRVVKVAVGNVPRTGLDGFSFKPEHKPISENRAHSEVRAYGADGSFVPYPPVGVRKQFREDLAAQVSFEI